MVLKNLLLNSENLFIFLDKYNGENLEEVTEPKWQLFTTSFFHNKQLSKCYQIAQIIQDKEIDIVSLVEVGGRESLENFNKLFLDSAYEVFHHPSNSDRGIDTGFLVKKSISQLCELKHLNNNILDNKKKFSRGLLKLKLSFNGKDYYFLLCHLKSKLDIKKEDFEGRGQRFAEVKEIVKEAKYLERLDADSRVCILGDFNGIIFKDETEQELKPFEDNNLIDLLERNNTGPIERTTYVYFKRNNQDNFSMQLDYVLANQAFSNQVKEAYVCDFTGHKSPNLPRTLKERKKLPSDHFPYYFELRLPNMPERI